MENLGVFVQKGGDYMCSRFLHFSHDTNKLEQGAMYLLINRRDPSTAYIGQHERVDEKSTRVICRHVYEVTAVNGKVVRGKRAPWRISRFGHWFFPVRVSELNRLFELPTKLSFERLCAARRAIDSLPRLAQHLVFEYLQGMTARNPICLEESHDAEFNLNAFKYT
jgi:hypothetical protein